MISVFEERSRQCLASSWRRDFFAIAGFDGSGFETSGFAGSFAGGVFCGWPQTGDARARAASSAIALIGGPFRTYATA